MQNYTDAYFLLEYFRMCKYAKFWMLRNYNKVRTYNVLAYFLVRMSFVNLKSNLALKSNKSHNLMKGVSPSKMSNNSCFPTKRRI